MAGTLTISQLSDGTNSTSSTNCIQGSAKAWAKWNGSGGVSGITSYNVSSITRSGAGSYAVSFTNALADANYVVAGSGNDSVTTFIVAPSAVTVPTASTCQITVNNSSASSGDNSRISVAFFR